MISTLKKYKEAVVASIFKTAPVWGGVLQNTYWTMVWHTSFHWDTWVETHLLSSRLRAAQQWSWLRCLCRKAEAQKLLSKAFYSKSPQIIASCLLIFGVSRGGRHPQCSFSPAVMHGKNWLPSTIHMIFFHFIFNNWLNF